MSRTSPKDFYAEKGLKRTTVTLRPSTVDALGEQADKYTESFGKRCTQGEIIDAVMMAILSDPQMKAIADESVKRLIEAKEVKKAGRPVSTLEGKLRNLSDIDRAELEALIESKQ